MTAVLCSAANGPHEQLLDLAEPSFRKYTETFGMDLHVVRGFHIDRPASWFKLDLVTDLLGSYDTVVWVDADAMCVNFERNILSVTSNERPLWMLQHKVAGMNHLLPNAGVFVAHNNPETLAFFEQAQRLHEFIEHPWWEQAAFLHLFGFYVAPNVGWAQPIGKTEWTKMPGWFGTEYNSMYHDPHPDPVIRHWSGLPFMERVEGMTHEANASSVRP